MAVKAIVFLVIVVCGLLLFRITIPYASGLSCDELFGQFSNAEAEYCKNWYDCSGSLDLENSCKPNWKSSSIPRECFYFYRDIPDATLVNYYCSNADAVMNKPNVDCKNNVPPTLEDCVEKLMLGGITGGSE